MKKKFAALVIGGIITVSAFGFGYSVNAAEKNAEQKPAMHNMMQGGHMDAKAMGDMMKDPAKCVEMMKSPEMQGMMKDMMKTPEMQVMMKQMLQNDAELHKIMLDLVNSVDMSEHDHAAPRATASEHNSHH
ncbi:hypothetical protein [Dendrosporobacter sp. 1207_IL3150]|uniref:hypothetical protein n=1 Tax=Dendrosporobacter sp. 1207_IL3150 TaxID=3084054 RepID=UPI002FD8EF51